MMLIILIVILALVFHFEPRIDRLKTGEYVIWYNDNRYFKKRQSITWSEFKDKIKKVFNG